MLEYLKTYLNEEAIGDFHKAEILLNAFFSLVDFSIIVFCIILFFTELRHNFQIGYQLIGIFIVDIIIRLYFIYSFKIDNSSIFYKEIISCLFSTDLFFLLLSLFKEILKALKIQEDLNIVYPCLFYILLSFSYENIISYAPITFDRYVLSFSAFILFAQFSFSLVFTYYVYDILKQGFGSIVSSIIKDKNGIRPIHKFIFGAPISCLFIFIVYFIIKLWILFCRDPLTILYGSLISGIIKDGAKYFVFASCVIIVYLLNKVAKEENKNRGDLEEIQIINS